MREDTTIVTAGRHPDEHNGSVNPPVYHASTILSATLDEYEYRDIHKFDVGQVYYGRFGTPTTFALAEAVAALEGGYAAITTGSGKAAIVASLTAFLEAGDHLLMTDSAYGPTHVICDRLLKRLGIETTYYDPLVGAGIAGLMRENTRVVFLESPGSQTFEVQDVPAITEAAHNGGATVIMDNTWASPLYFKPLEHGVDISVQAATKYVVGHADAMVGIATTATEAAWAPLVKAFVDLGASVGSEEAYLAQRGLRTLSVRMPRHQDTGIALAEWLKGRPEVERVLHPALPDDPGHALWQRDFTGASGLFGVVLKESWPRAALAAMLDGLVLFGMGDSWGAYESLIVPASPERFRKATTWDAPGRTLRVHAGLEHPDDLIADLEGGFARLNAAG